MQKKGNYYFWKHMSNLSDRDDMILLQSLPNGDSYRVFLEQLIEKSVSKMGYVMAKNNTPYSDKQIAIITRRSEEFVKEAVAVLVEYGFIEKRKDEIICINEVEELIGKGSVEYDEKKARKRAKQDHENEVQMTDNCPTNVRQMSENDSQFVREKTAYIEIDSEIEKEQEEYSISSIPPTYEEFAQYCKINNPDANQQEIYSYYSSRDWKIGNRLMTISELKEKVRSWKQYTKTNKQQDFIASEEMQYEDVDLQALHDRMFGGMNNESK